MAKITPELFGPVARALMDGDVEGAMSACRKAGLDLFDEASLAEEVRLVLTRTPKALADCPSGHLRALRVAAALMNLFGVSSIRGFVTVDDDYAYRRSPETVALLLLAHAQVLRALASYRDLGISKIKLLAGGGDGVCPVCREADGKVYAVEAAPELPHADCSCRKCCACMFVAVDEGTA